MARRNPPRSAAAPTRTPVPAAAAATPRPPPLLRELLREQSVFCLASVSRAGAWCAPLFFASLDGGRHLVFVSDPASRHSRELGRDRRAAAAVWLANGRAEEIRGVQMTGQVRELAGRDSRRARAAFLRRHPQAAPVLAARRHERFFAFEIATAKVTDNRRGFGFKAEFRLRPATRR